MKNIVIKSVFGRNASISLLFVLGIFFVVGFACGGGSSAPPPAGYVGFWTGEDGSTITIRGDGGADYKNGGTSISGGSVTIDESAKTLKISFASLGPNFTIDKAPAGDKMTLSGVVYKKGGSDSKTDSTTSNGKLEIPGKDKLQTLVKTTMLDFNDAVQSGDFSDFHKKTATVWRDSITPDELREAFKKMVDNKNDFNLKKAISSLDATFTPEPKIAQIAGTDAVVVEGFYPTTPKKLYFTLKYAIDDGVLKLIGINLETKDH